MQLPPSLQVMRDELAEREWVERARRWLESHERLDGWHASDLLLPRRAYWRRVEPQPMAPRDVGLFLVGRVLHAYYQAIARDHPVALSETDEGTQLWRGLAFSPDLVREGRPIEVKTSRKPIREHEPERVRDLETYLRQLLVYFACLGVSEGELHVLYTNAKDEEGRSWPLMRIYRVTIAADDLRTLQDEVLREAQQLQEALEARDHRRLPLCPEWACGRTRCDWWDACQPEGRWSP